MRTLILVTLVAAACSKPNPYYCPGNPDDNCLIDADINAPQGCATSAECTNGAKPICEPKEKVCVACTDGMPGSCGGTTPVCTSAHDCTGCTLHGQCDSTVCLPSGACAETQDVAYVTPNGTDGNGCTKSSPCKTVAAALALGRGTIKILGNIDEAVVVASGTVQIFGEGGSTLRRTTSQGPVFEARGTGTAVMLSDLIIRDASGATGHGIYVAPGEPVDLTLNHVYAINNAANGLNVQGGKLTMSRSVVSGNSGGGAVVAGMFSITNSLFVANGNGVSTTGGITLTPQTTTTVFKFNTVADNFSSASSAAVRGVNCTLPQIAANTIIAGNAVSANCTFSYSLFDTGTIVTGSNIAGDPMFKNIDGLDPLASDYFHIQPTSAAVDHADPGSTMATDIDGEARPQGNAPDIGADELQ